MKRVIFLTQSYDPQSTILGVTRDWVRALADRVAGVDVIAVRTTGGQVSDPTRGSVRVDSLGKENRRTAQLWAFFRTLARRLPDAGAVFVHMVPRYAVLAYPLVALARCPIVLWYAQGGVNRDLRIASRLVDKIITPTRDSFPLAGASLEPRIHVTGHGIDTQRYTPDALRLADARSMLAVGRLSPSKRYDTLIEAAARLQTPNWRLRIAGPPLYASDREYAVRLHSQAAGLRIDHALTFLGNVPYEQMPHEYRRAWLLAHSSGTGSLDKVVLEAMACGTPVVSSAPSSRAIIGAVDPSLCAADESAGALADALEGTLTWTPERRRQVGQALRQEVERHHSLSGWAEQVAHLLLG
jgi:glycosyltransferase involved in cell wall biosynthesis